jgi:poly(3-hydroxybutyrate) depolymerase
MINGERVRVRMVTVWRSPWARLLHFTRDYGDLRKAGKRGLEPPVLIAAPMSGHYADPAAWHGRGVPAGP